MIPKIIHYCWFGGAPKPKSVKRCISSWKKHCPDYEIKEWNENNLDVSINKFTREAYDSHAWGFVPDYLRLWIVYKYGGIYLDTDVQMIKSFDSLLDKECFMGLEDENTVALGLGFGAEQGNRIIAAHMKKYETISFINNDGTLNKTPSPIYSTEVMQEYGFVKGCNKIHNLDGATIYPVEYFCPKDFHTGITNVTDNTFSIHQYDASWYTNEQQKNKKQRWKKYKIDWILHIPNRGARKLLGQKNYQKLKNILKGIKSL